MGSKRKGITPAAPWKEKKRRERKKRKERKERKKERKEEKRKKKEREEKRKKKRKKVHCDVESAADCPRSILGELSVADLCHKTRLPHTCRHVIKYTISQLVKK